MLIQRLVEYAERTIPDELAQHEFEKVPVRWRIDIDGEGRLLEVVDLATQESRRGMPRLAGKTPPRNSGEYPRLGTDSAAYVLGPAPDSRDRDKGRRHHEAFKALLRKVAAETGDPGLTAGATFYDDPGRVEQARQRAAKAAAGDVFALALSSDLGLTLAERPAAREFWRRLRSPVATGEMAGGSPTDTLCLSCGNRRPPQRTHQTKIKGLMGGQPAGTSLVSFDKEAFTSHGWDKSENAAVCADCAEAYTRGLNRLLDRRSEPPSRLNEGDTAFVYWSSSAGGESLLSLIENPQPEQVRRLLTAPYSGIPPTAAPGDALRLLALRANGGRAVVSGWLETTLGEASESLARWFRDLEIRLAFDEREKGETLRYAGETARPPRLRVLALATARDAGSISPRVAPALVEAALLGRPLPLALATSAVQRIVRERFPPWITPPRLGLIRAVLNRQPRETGVRPMTPELDPDQEDPGYLCGRLLAILDRLQYAAVGDVGADIIDRFYGRASTSPAAAFPLLMRLGQSHLGRLRRDKPGLATNISKDLEEVTARFNRFPSVLSMEQQGRFALGFYHQLAALRSRGRGTGP